jgi:hypothetical protein
MPVEGEPPFAFRFEGKFDLAHESVEEAEARLLAEVEAAIDQFIAEATERARELGIPIPDEPDMA